MDPPNQNSMWEYPKIDEIVSFLNDENNILIYSTACARFMRRFKCSLPANDKKSLDMKTNFRSDKKHFTFNLPSINSSLFDDQQERSFTSFDRYISSFLGYLCVIFTLPRCLLRVIFSDFFLNTLVIITELPSRKTDKIS